VRDSIALKSQTTPVYRTSTRCLRQVVRKKRSIRGKADRRGDFAIAKLSVRSNTRSPHNENKEKKKGKSMGTTDTKKESAETSETIDELFHEAMRS
jgi:hypothetical protein